MLEGKTVDESGAPKSLTPDEVSAAVTRNMLYILDGECEITSLYGVLKDFVEASHVEISKSETKLLAFYSDHTAVGRFFKRVDLAQEHDDDSAEAQLDPQPALSGSTEGSQKEGLLTHERQSAFGVSRTRL